MVMRYEDAAAPLVVRWQDAQPDKVYWEATEVWTPPSSVAVTSRTFVITVGNLATPGSPLWGWGSGQSGFSAGGVIVPVPTNIGHVSVDPRGNVSIFGKTGDTIWADSSSLTNVMLSSPQISESPLTLAPRDGVNPLRWRTRPGGTTYRPAVGATWTVTISSDDARLVAI